MPDKPEDFLVQAWKQQFDTGLRALEAVIEGASRIRDKQLEAATAAHADLEATRKAIAAATDPAQVLMLQGEWARANMAKSLEYWGSIYQTLIETDAELARCLFSQAPMTGAAGRKAADLDASKEALLGMIDNAYKQWFGATQQFYKLPAIPAQPGSDTRAAA